MKRTSPGSVVLAGVVGAVLGFTLQAVLAAMSVPKVRPEYTVSLSLALLAVIVIALAVPIRRATHATPPRRVDPFHATRVVMLAKASSLVGAFLGGAAVGFLVDLLARPVDVAADLVLRVVAALVAAAILLVAGLVAEFLCRVPPDDRGPKDPADGPPNGSVEA